MKKIAILFALGLLSGCSPSPEDYKNIMLKCHERNAQYFIMMVPSMFGTRLSAGCLEK
jgi:hypothetical protein